MLYPFTHWPAEALDLPGDSMQGNKVPAGHSNLVRAACLGPLAAAGRPSPVPFSTGGRSAHPISSSGLATQHTLARTRCQCPCYPQHCCGGEPVQVSSDIHGSDQKCGLDGEVLIFPTSCTLPPTTQRTLAVRTEFLTGTGVSYQLTDPGSDQK